MGLMLAVGMLVDNAVVITESIFRERSQSKESPNASTIKGVKEVGLAVIAGTAIEKVVSAAGELVVARHGARVVTGELSSL